MEAALCGYTAAASKLPGALEVEVQTEPRRRLKSLLIKEGENPGVAPGHLRLEGPDAEAEEVGPEYCSACFSGNYPIPLPEEGQDQLRLFEKVRE